MKQSNRTILHIVSNLKTGGAENIIHKIISSPDANHILVCLISGKDYEIKNVTVYDLNIKKNNFLKVILQLPKTIFTIRKIVKKHCPDVILAWLTNPAIFTIFFKDLKVPIYWSIQGEPVTKSTASIFGRTSQKICKYFSHSIPSKIIYCSDNVANKYSEYGFDNNNKMIIRNGIDLNKFKFSKTIRNSFRKENSLTETDIVIGWMARYSKVKDPYTFIKAIGDINHKNAKFIMAGPNVDHNNNELVSFIKSVKMENKITLLGNQKHPVNFYNGIDIFCLSSISEGEPLSLMEASACNCITLSTEVGDWHKSKSEHFICPVDNSDAMGKSILSAILSVDKKSIKKSVRSSEETVQDYIKAI